MHKYLNSPISMELLKIKWFRYRSFNIANYIILICKVRRQFLAANFPINDLCVFCKYLSVTKVVNNSIALLNRKIPVPTEICQFFFVFFLFFSFFFFTRSVFGHWSIRQFYKSGSVHTCKNTVDHAYHFRCLNSY